jgi:hypothetical protein
MSSLRVLLIRRSLVSAYFADRIQQIHSLRASGVIFSHAVIAAGAAARAFCKSAGTLCAAPAAIPFLAISLFQQTPYFSKDVSKVRLA